MFKYNNLMKESPNLPTVPKSSVFEKKSKKWIAPNEPVFDLLHVS